MALLKFVYRFIWLGVLLCYLIFLSGCQTSSLRPGDRLNPDLNSVKPDYRGNTFDGKRFVGPFSSVGSGAGILWNYFIWKIQGGKAARSEVSMVPVQEYINTDEPHIAWLGHATVLIHINNKTILVDPILGSPRLFHGSRLNEIPVTASELNIDYLLATHAHRDHLDKETVQNLGGENIHALVPLEVDKLLRRWRADIKAQAAGWYQTYSMDSDITITLLPAFHWSRRGLFDTNTMLWGSYMISAGGLTIYVAGDTGYAGHFAEIGKLYDIDYAFLPIGSYNPTHLHGNGHMTPELAVRAFQDLKAKVMIPVHYGTYNLSAEPINEPEERLKAIEGTLPVGSIKFLGIGETARLTVSTQSK